MTSAMGCADGPSAAVLWGYMRQVVMSQPAPPKSRGRSGSLVALVGAASAIALLTMVPKEESGRKVAVTVDDRGAATVRHISGPLYLNAYLDVAGILTACDGITRGVHRGQRYTPEECGSMLERELASHAEGVLRCTPTLAAADRHWQRVAAVSFAYNVGVSAFCGSTVMRRFNAQDWVGGCNALLAWDKARVRGRLQRVAGLTARRRREHALCLRGL